MKPKSAMVECVDKASAFFKHMRVGRELLPVIDGEDLQAAEHFEIPVVFSYWRPETTGGAIVPVLPWGAYVAPVRC